MVFSHHQILNYFLSRFGNILFLYNLYLLFYLLEILYSFLILFCLTFLLC